ncbi:MAG: hypothetical protein N2554_02475 [Fimbriimonadales bacterium]|nr:hypothetical protein [Fimbriimonadales bacterium]
MRPIFALSLTITVFALATAQLRAVWRYEFDPPGDRQAQIERVVRLHNGGWLLLGSVQTELNGDDALAIRLMPNGTAAWVYQTDGAGFDDAFVDGVVSVNGNELLLLGRFTDADGYLQAQVHRVSQTGQLQSVLTRVNALGGHLRPLRFGYQDTLWLYAELISVSGESQLIVYDTEELWGYGTFPFRPWGVSYAPYSLNGRSFVGGTSASTTNLVDARILFPSEFVDRYSGPARGFDIPVAIAPIDDWWSGVYIAIVSEGSFTSDDVVLLHYGAHPLRWGYRYDYQLQTDLPESLAVDPQGRANLLVRTVLWRDEPFETEILRLLRFSTNGVLQEDVLLDIPPSRLLSGLLRINASGQRFVATQTLLGRIGDGGQLLWRYNTQAFIQELFAEPDGALVIAGERPVRDQYQYEIERRLVVVKYAPSVDINGDGCVDDADLLAVLFAFGQSGSNLITDVNGDGRVDDGDLLMVLFSFGEGC